MAVTLTPRLGEPQWGSGADSPSRSIFNGAFLTIDQKAAYDDGTNPSALPTSDVVSGRYVHVVNGTTRQLMRRAASGWQQVGGNTWSEIQYERAAAGLLTTDRVRETSHPSLTNPTIVETWDGGSVRGGRFAIGEVNSSVPSALHVGDIASAVDLAFRGRIYARTGAAGHRGFVASAHAADAGPLFTAREPGGTDAWTVDSQGRMRSQVPTAFGAGVLTAGVPLSVAPGTADVSGVDLYAASGKPAQRWFRAAGDAAAIGSVEQDRITLGRASWAGATIALLAPNIDLTGALGLTGSAVISAKVTAASAQVNGTLGVTGTSTLGAVNAAAITGSNITGSGTVQGAAVTATGALTAQGGKVTTASVSTEGQVRTAVITTGGTVRQQSVRQPVMSRKVVTTGIAAAGPTGTDTTLDVSMNMPEDGHMRMVAELLISADLGLSGTIETAQLYWDWELRTTGGSSLARQTYGFVSTLTTDDSSRQIPGRGNFAIEDVFVPYLTAGNYVLRLHYSYSSILVPHIDRIKLLVQPVVLQNNSGVN